MQPPHSSRKGTESDSEKDPRWLSRYSTPFHDWIQHSSSNNTHSFRRPLGLVELSFDADGTLFGGRADMTATLTLALSHSLSTKEQVRRRTVAAWTALRLRHVLLMARAVDCNGKGEEGWGREFVVDVPGDVREAVDAVEREVVWVEDFYGGKAEVDVKEFHDHALNVARIVDPSVACSKLLVHPLRKLDDGTFELSFLVIMAHQISDGLSAYGWFKDLIRLLNLPQAGLEAEIATALDLDVLRARLPPAQESLYPRIAVNIARRRWIWAILRVLRHVQHTLPVTFPNPLYRPKRLDTARPLSPVYDKLLTYTGPAALFPPNSTGHITATLSPAASTRLIALCRSANLSIGAGCFALAGLAMMDLQSSLHSSSSTSPPPPMTASFPLNPRGWLIPPPSPDSCMLAFSDGIVLPHLPHTLPIEQRFLLTARSANRELRAYQKRLPPTTTTTAANSAAISSTGMDRHAPGRLLATGYLALVERVEGKLPAGKRLGLGSPQGELAARSGTMATCGVSSVGSLKGFFRRGEYDLDLETADGGRDFGVDYRGLRMGVRAREGEFLVGSSTDAEGRVGFGVSYDASAIDPERAEVWARTIAGLLEKESGSKL